MLGIFTKIYNSTRNTIVIYVFIAYLLITYLLLVALIVLGLDYTDYLLRDDGYYLMAKNFARGIFDSDSVIGPGLPLIYTPIHFFSESLHPFIRLFISQIAVLIILLIVSDLTRKHLNNKQLFWGLVLIIIHPVFIHWSFRTSVDLFLSLFLGIFILFLHRYLEKGKIISILISFLAFTYTIFTRPSFIFIPILLLMAAILFLKSRKIIIVSTILFITTTLFYFANNYYLQQNSESNKISVDGGRSNLIVHNLILTEVILETGQLHKGTIDNYNIEESSRDKINQEKGTSYINSKYSEFLENYKIEYPNQSFIHMIWYYIKNHPGVFLAKVLVGPVFFFILSSREIMSYVLLLFSIVYFTLIVMSLKSLIFVNANKQYFVVLFSILFGYFLLHWVTHSYSRYSLVILPYLFIWTGPYIVQLIDKYKLRITNR